METTDTVRDPEPYVADPGRRRDNPVNNRKAQRELIRKGREVIAGAAAELTGGRDPVEVARDLRRFLDGTRHD